VPATGPHGLNGYGECALRCIGPSTLQNAVLRWRCESWRSQYSAQSQQTADQRMARPS